MISLRRARYGTPVKTHAIGPDGRSLCHVVAVLSLMEILAPIEIGPPEIIGDDCSGTVLRIAPAEVARFVSCGSCRRSIASLLRRAYRAGSDRKGSVYRSERALESVADPEIEPVAG